MDANTPKPSAGQKVLVVKREGADETTSGLSLLVEKLKQKVGELGSVEIQALNGTLKGSTFSACYVGYDLPSPVDGNFLDQLLRTTQLGGIIYIREPITELDNDASGLRTEGRIKSALRLAGFVDVKTTTQMEGSQLLCCAEAHKPAYEVGASVALKLPSASATKVSNGDSGSIPSAAKARQVWTLSANDILDDEVELLDSDTVLDESDFKKPDPTSLKAVCGDASTKRKACKDCSCGLAERLKDESNPALDPSVDTQVKASSCGSCYLGDAFRCAGCPYAGMPAFKPGERVLLAVQADI